MRRPGELFTGRIGKFGLASRKFQCRCGAPVFFRNTQCLACGAPLGFEPNLGKVYALEPSDQPGIWRLSSGPKRAEALYRRCENLTTAAGCNWLSRVSKSDPNLHALCQCCRLDRTIPDLSIPANAEAYRRICVAKRRLIAFLIALGLPVRSRISEDPERGLAFDLLRSPEQGPRVLTGHAQGIITLNIEEAEDATRERIRREMGEPYRTLLGHLRHETGHYYWDRLIACGAWLEQFRKLFGDEQTDYSAALQNAYQQGPPANWQQCYVSAYASAHPWEDWAETWAHYLHMMDTLESALGFGLDPEVSLDFSITPFTAEILEQEGPNPDGAGFLKFLNSWTRLTAVLNELSRAMGLNDFYPFVLSNPAAAKLHFVHRVVNGWRVNRDQGGM